MNKILSLAVRYLLVLFAGMGNLFIFYKIFYPLTFFSSYFLLSFFGDVISVYSVSLIIFNKVSIELIDACIAGSAYYLLFILAMSLPNIKIKKRFSIIGFSFAMLLILNVIRIVIMGLIAGTVYFESVHMLFWYIVSLVFVVGIWFLSVKLFSIKEIPVYSDVIFLINQIKKSKRKTKYNKSSN